jgi:hypothetical protein
MEKEMITLPEITSLYPSFEELRAVASGKAIYPDTLLFRHDLTSEAAMYIIAAISEGQLVRERQEKRITETVTDSNQNPEAEVRQPLASKAFEPRSKAQEQWVLLQGVFFLILALVVLFVVGALANEYRLISFILVLCWSIYRVRKDKY